MMMMMIIKYFESCSCISDFLSTLSEFLNIYNKFNLHLMMAVEEITKWKNSWKKKYYILSNYTRQIKAAKINE